jgi:ketosteroid isomerase-like protein
MPLRLSGERDFVRIQISETMDTPDTQKVLQVLENCLREVSSEAVSSDHQIVLHGLGPSPVSFNHRDITVLRLHSDGDKTVIDGDVNFQASALLGASSQDSVVRTKLERVFQKVKTELRQEMAAPAAAREEVVPAAFPVMGNSTESTESTAAVLPGKTDEGAETVAYRFAEAAPKWADIPAPQLWPPRRHRELEPEDDPPSHGWKWAALTIALLLVLAGAAIFLLRGKRISIFVVTRPQPVASSPEASSVTPKVVQPERREDTGKAVETIPSGPAPNPPDPKAWLEGWAGAMRSRDAAAQAGFYADTVDQYLGRRDVSRDAVQKDREATIRMRKGLWTMKMEDVVVERRTDSEVQVRLVKHYIDQPASGETLESYVPTRLVLKRMDGSWKITSEQDLTTSSNAADDHREPIPIMR